MSAANAKLFFATSSDLNLDSHVKKVIISRIITFFPQNDWGGEQLLLVVVNCNFLLYAQVNSRI
jgi:sensor domain CHASE-containing protein